MNAKEDIITVFRHKISELENLIDRLKKKHGWLTDAPELKILHDAIKNDFDIITATEAAIFDVPSEEEIISKTKGMSIIYRGGFYTGCNFILNYKNKTE